MWLQAVNKACVYSHTHIDKLLPAENIRAPLQFLIRSNVNTNSWQCCTTHQELSISSTLKMCFMCLCDWACVCIQRACKSLVICHLCILHKCHPKGMCAHTHIPHTRTHRGSCRVLHEQVSQTPAPKSNTRAPPTASASSVPLPLLFRQAGRALGKHQQEAAARVQCAAHFYPFH